MDGLLKRYRAGLLVVWILSSAGAAEPKRVLMLHSLERDVAPVSNASHIRYVLARESEDVHLLPVTAVMT